MKGNIKRIISLLCALVIMLSTNIGLTQVFAENNGTITVNNAIDGKTYGVYRIFDLTYKESGSEKSVAYTISDKWKEFFTTGKGKEYIVNDNTGSLNPIVVEENGQAVVKYIDITDSNVVEFAKVAMDEMKNIERDAIAKESNKVAKFENLPLGYYLVHPQGATKPADGQTSIVSLTSTLPNGEVVSKGDYPTIEKKAKEKSADIYKEVEFELTTKVPDTTGYDKYIFDLTDTLSKGLDYVDGSIKVKIQDSKVTDNYTTDYDSNGRILKISFDMQKFQEKVGQQVVISYKAKINKDAVIGNDGNPNKVELAYSNDPKKSDSKEKTPPEIVKVYTGKITIIKHKKGDDSIKLKDAEFVLYKKDNVATKYYKATKAGDKVEKIEWIDKIDDATKLTTNDEGTLTFEGLKAGTYYLKETKAPAGYNLLTTDTEVTLSDDDSGENTLKMEAESKIENSTGIELPKTGGAGTTLLSLIGGTIIIYAVYSLVRNKIKFQAR